MLLTVHPGVLLRVLCRVPCVHAHMPEGYESLSEIRLSAKKRNALSLLLADTRLREDGEHDNLNSSFITRVHGISEQLPSNRWGTGGDRGERLHLMSPHVIAGLHAF